MVLPSGQGVKAVDALVVFRGNSTAPAESRSHRATVLMPDARPPSNQTNWSFALCRLSLVMSEPD
jgi:hypothetical protein